MINFNIIYQLYETHIRLHINSTVIRILFLRLNYSYNDQNFILFYFLYK